MHETGCPTGCTSQFRTPTVSVCNSLCDQNCMHYNRYRRLYRETAVNNNVVWAIRDQSTKHRSSSNAEMLLFCPPHIGIKTSVSSTVAQQTPTFSELHDAVSKSSSSLSSIVIACIVGRQLLNRRHQHCCFACATRLAARALQQVKTFTYFE